MGDVDPVLLLATTDETSRDVLGSELRRRYGGDYEVVVCASYEHARAVLEGLRRWGRQVALVIACFGPDDRDGLDFLRRAYSLHPSAKRAVAAIWGDFASTSDVFAADRPRARRARPPATRAPARRGVPRRDHRHAGRLAPRPGHRLRGGADDRRAARRAHPRAARPVRAQPHPRRLPPGRHGVRQPAAGRARAQGPRAPGAPARLHQPTHDARRAHRPRDRRRLRAHGTAAGRPGVRRRGGRRRAQRPGGRGLRLLRGVVDDGGRAVRGGRAGRHVLAHPQLSRLLARRQRRAPGLPVVPAGLVLRQRVLLPARGAGARHRRRPADGRHVRRQRHPHPQRRHRHRRRLPPPRRAHARGPRRTRGVLRGGRRRGALDGRDGGLRHRRRQLGRAGRPPPGSLRPPRDAAGAGRVARGEHVGVPHRAARRHAQRRHPLRHGGAGRARGGRVPGRAHPG